MTPAGAGPDDVIIVTREDIVSTPATSVGETDQPGPQLASEQEPATRRPAPGDDRASDTASDAAGGAADESGPSMADDSLASPGASLRDDRPDDDMADMADGETVPDAPVTAAGEAPRAAGAAPPVMTGTTAVPGREPPAGSGRAPAGPDQAVAGRQGGDAEPADLSGANWREIQSLFVDDPRQAVELGAQAAGAALAALTAAARDREQSLRDGWESGRAGTEDLRTALQRYRDLAGRLSSIAREL